jgi:hypothetical protein
MEVCVGECFFSGKIGPTYYCGVTGEECIRETGRLCPWLCMQYRARQINRSAEQQADNIGIPKLPEGLLKWFEQHCCNPILSITTQRNLNEILEFIVLQLRAGA